MKRRNFIQLSSVLSFVGLAPAITRASEVDTKARDGVLNANGLKDRMYWVQLLDKIASPILSNMRKGELRKNMPMDYSPAWDNRNKEVAYMEAIGRLIVGMAPFVALPDDDTEEGRIRKKMRDVTTWKNLTDWFLWVGGNHQQHPVGTLVVWCGDVSVMLS